MRGVDGERSSAPARAGPPCPLLRTFDGFGHATPKPLDAFQYRRAILRRPEPGRQAAGDRGIAPEGLSANENIPPYVPNEPMRGPDPANPPLDPSETRTPPQNVQPPPVPNREELKPPRIDPRDFIEIFPDQSEAREFPIFVENRHGLPPVQRQNRRLGDPFLGIAGNIFKGGTVVQTGGPLPSSRKRYSEEFDRFRYREEFGITSNAGGDFKDLSYLITYKGVTFQVIINTITTEGEEEAPTRREDRQRAKMVLNALDNTLIIDVGKLRKGQTIDMAEWSRFLESHLKKVRSMVDREEIKRVDKGYRILDRFILRK